MFFNFSLESRNKRRSSHPSHIRSGSSNEPSMYMTMVPNVAQPCGQARSTSRLFKCLSLSGGPRTPGWKSLLYNVYVRRNIWLDFDCVFAAQRGLLYLGVEVNREIRKLQACSSAITVPTLASRRLLYSLTSIIHYRVAAYMSKFVQKKRNARNGCT